MRWTRAAREMRQETVDELVQEDPERSLRRLRAYLEFRHGIKVTAQTVHLDLKALGYVRIWARLDGWSAERADADTDNSSDRRDSGAG